MNAANPEKPTGPPPAFEVTPIERLQERRFPKPVEGPDLSADPRQKAGDDIEAESGTEANGEAKPEAPAQRVDLKL